MSRLQPRQLLDVEAATGPNEVIAELVTAPLRPRLDAPTVQPGGRSPGLAPPISSIG